METLLPCVDDLGREVEAPGRPQYNVLAMHQPQPSIAREGPLSKAQYSASLAGSSQGAVVWMAQWLFWALGLGGGMKRLVSAPTLEDQVKVCRLGWTWGLASKKTPGDWHAGCWQTDKNLMNCIPSQSLFFSGLGRPLGCALPGLCPGLAFLPVRPVLCGPALQPCDPLVRSEGGVVEYGLYVFWAVSRRHVLEAAARTSDQRKLSRPPPPSYPSQVWRRHPLQAGRPHPQGRRAAEHIRGPRLRRRGARVQPEGRQLLLLQLPRG